MDGHRSLDVDLTDPWWFVNDDASRTFLGLTTGTGTGGLLALVGLVNSVLAKEGCPTFYEDPVMHASLCWAAGDHRGRFSADATGPCAAVPPTDPLRKHLVLPLRLHATTVQLRAGNKFFSFPLHTGWRSGA